MKKYCVHKIHWIFFFSYSLNYHNYSIPSNACVNCKLRRATAKKSRTTNKVWLLDNAKQSDPFEPLRLADDPSMFTC